MITFNKLMGKNLPPRTDSGAFDEPNLIRIKADPNNVDRLNSLELIQTPIFKSSGTKFKGRKMFISVKPPSKYVIRIYALGSAHEKVGV